MKPVGGQKFLQDQLQFTKNRISGKFMPLSVNENSKWCNVYTGRYTIPRREWCAFFARISRVRRRQRQSACLHAGKEGEQS